MQSGDKGHLGSMFDDFEFEPRPELWDRIESQSTGPEEAGNLAPMFTEYTHAPHSRVWRAIANQLQPGRRRRAVIWWSVAAGIALLIGFTAAFRAGTDIGASGAGTGGEWAAGEESIRLVRDAESGVEGSGAIEWRDSLRALFADGSGNCINLNPYQVIPLDLDFQFGPLWDQMQWGQYQNQFQYQMPGTGNDHFAYQNPYMNGYPDPFGNWNLNVWPQTVEELEESKALKEMMNSGMDSRTPDLMAMESDAGSFGLSYVDLADVRKKKPDLETRLGSSLSPTANLRSLSNADLNLDNADPTYHQGVNSGGGTGLDINALAEESLSVGSNEVFRTPISIGFAMQWYLSNRWSLLPGLAYQRVNSEVDNTNGLDGEIHKFTRNYLGVTAGVQYDLVKRERYQLYATGGMQYDMGMRITERIETLSGGETVDQSSKSGPLGNQIGGSGGMGMRYKIGKRMGIYAQGTVMRYLHQSEYNLWSTKKYWPSAQVGLTLSL